MDYSIQNVIIHSFEWLKDWKIDRLWKFKYICFFFRVRMLQQLIDNIQLYFWIIERLDDWLIIYNYIFEWLKDWMIDRLWEWYVYFFLTIEWLNDWLIIVFFAWLKMDYIISMMGIYRRNEWLNDWMIIWILIYMYIFLFERLNDWMI